MTPQSTPITKAASAAFAAFLLASAVVLGFASPAGAQDDPATATIGGADCTGDNVEVQVMNTSGEELLTENVTPEADGTWRAPLTISVVNEPVIASATCFAGDVAVVEYSPISLRVQAGVAVGGVIELPSNIVEGAAPAADGDAAPETTPETLPETGPFTVPATGLALAMIAAGTGMAFVARQSNQQVETATAESTWPTSHWDR